MTKKDKIFSLSVICSIFILALLYFLVPDMAINTNRLMEMLFTDDSKGISMYYYEFRNLSYVISILASAMQIIIPPICKLAVIKANGSFFGSSLGMLLSLTGIVLGLSCSYAIGKCLSYMIFKNAAREKFKASKFINSYIAILIFIVSILWQWPFIFVGYISGLLIVDFKKFIPAITAGKLISLCYLLFA